MRAFFEGIEDFFVNYGFAPYDALRHMDSWWAANTVSWIFVLIGIVAMVYWLGQLRLFDQRGEEDYSISSHSYL